MRYLLALGFVIYYYAVNAQVLPKDGDILNYRIIGFEIPPVVNTTQYVLEVFYVTDDSRDAPGVKCLSATSSTNRIIAKVPDWATSYAWRITAYNKKSKKIGAEPMHYFSTLACRYADTSLYKILVKTRASKYKDMLILQDYMPAMFDVDGKIVWFIPDTPGAIDSNQRFRNLRPTTYGTFTIQTDTGVYEFDYHGHLLWNAPNTGEVSGDTVEHYHHDFKRMPNGNYMVAGLEYIERKLPADADTLANRRGPSVAKKNGWFYKTIESPTLIEYDKTGKVVWYWKASEHTPDSVYFKLELGGRYNTSLHMNSFYLDEKSNQIYLSYRNYNQITKIEYPSGRVLANYSGYSKSESKMLFRGQHCVLKADNGLIYLFNNNTEKTNNIISDVRVFKENERDTTLEQTWSFSCDIDTFASKYSMGGGGVSLLPNNEILVATASAGRIFMVDENKNITGNYIITAKQNGKWANRYVYRAYSILNLDELEKFIFR